MSEGTVSKQLPKWVEPRKLAQIGGEFHGIVAPTHLPRLLEVCVDIERVVVELQFCMNDQGKRMLEGNIRAQLQLQCQRCMEGLSFVIDTTMSLTMVWDEQEADALSKNLDAWIVGEGEHDLHQAVEDEILLALPPVAYHDYDCVDPELYSVGEEVLDQPAEKDNPFSVLEQLKKH